MLGESVLPVYLVATARPRTNFESLSWNKALALKRAFGMGGEFKKKGANILLGPVVGPMGRTVRGGRNWEGEQARAHVHSTARRLLVACEYS